MATNRTMEDEKPKGTTHVLITPWLISNGVFMTWCGMPSNKSGKADFVAGKPEAVNCEKCKTNMRMALDSLSSMVPRLLP